MREIISIISLSQFSRSVVSDSSQRHGQQHARLPYPSPTPRSYSNSCPLSQWCHPTISSSVVPFSSCLQSFPASESSPRSQFFTSGGQIIGASASHQSFQWILRIDFKIDCLWPPCTPRDSQESSPTPQFKSNNSLVLSFFMVQLSHPYMTTGKTIPLTRWTVVGKIMFLLFNMLSSWS